MTEGEQMSSASAWLCPQLLRTGKRPRHGQGPRKAPAALGEAPKDRPCRAQPHAVRCGGLWPPALAGGARLGPLTLSSPHTYPTLRHSCHTAARTMTGSERGVNRTEQERNTTLRPVSARWPHPVVQLFPQPRPVRADSTTQPENTERTGTGGASLGLQAAALKLVPQEGFSHVPHGDRLSCPSGPPAAHFPPDLSFCLSGGDQASFQHHHSPGPSWGGLGSWQADVLGAGAPMDNSG